MTLRRSALQAMLAQWEDQYVMGCQRLSHHQALQDEGSPGAEPPGEPDATPRIQLF